MKMLSLIAVLLLPLSALANDNSATTYWIDVRTAEEYATGHLEQATLIPHQTIADKIAGITTDKDADIRLYCRSGGRAGKAKKALEALGYTNVTNEGGYKDVAKDLVK